MEQHDQKLDTIIIDRDLISTNAIIRAFIEGIVVTSEGYHMYTERDSEQLASQYLYDAASKDLLISACCIETPPQELWNYPCVRVEMGYNEKVYWVRDELIKLNNDELWVILFTITNKRRKVST